MNQEIADIIKGKIESLPFVDRIAGLVKPISYKQTTDKGTIIKTFPVGCGVTNAECIKGKFTDLVPDSKKKSIIYFEDLGITQANDNQQTFSFISNLKLVCWMNLDKLGKTDCSVSGLVAGAIMKQLPIKTFNQGSFIKIQITVNSQDIKNASIFSKYSYDETQMQYLMYPFDYFALNLTTKFTLKEDCIESFVNGTQIDCTDNGNV